MYSRTQLLKGLNDPSKVVREVRRQVGALQNRLAGDYLMDEDWDNLVLLDACRYDTFKSVNELDGRLERRRSAGSATLEFLENNFRNGPYHDVVYISANPHIASLNQSDFHDIVNVWHDNWDDGHGTVLPEKMTQRCIECAKIYPKKRLVCHYIQPHHPFLGPTADRELPDVRGNDHARRTVLTDDDGERDHVWRRLARGEIDLDTAEQAYRETLRRTLRSVRKLLFVLSDKTVVTSDHGNLFDEPAYGIGSFGTRRHDHPIYATAGPLVTVPWFVVPHETRKQVVADPPPDDDPEHDDDDGSASDAVEDRLTALGYR